MKRDLSITDARARLEKLRSEVNRYREAYHVHDQSLISDAALDALKQEIVDIEARFPDLITPESPSQRVAGRPLDAFTKVVHAQRILSLNDVFSLDDLRAWEARLKKLEPTRRWGYYCELKIDGLDLVLTYRNGALATAATRGDGSVGEDVTQNVRTIEAIPLMVNMTRLGSSPLLVNGSDLIVQGEVFLPRKAFEALNAMQKNNGEPLYANPRNVAAGSLRQLDPSITAARKLDAFIFNIFSDLGMKTHEEVHDVAQRLGFKTESHSAACASMEDVWAFIQHWEKRREKLPYQTDGVVVLVDNEDIRRGFGTVGKAPRGAVAFKYPAEQTTTRVEEIIVQVGRTGTLTPLALLTPVLVAGTTVSRATLHNMDQIQKLDVRAGDTVIVQKAGDIIPEIVEVLTRLRTGKEKKFIMPKTCPMCGGPVERDPDGVAYRCLNTTCFAIEREHLVHFASKGAMNIVGMGEKVIDRLMTAELIATPPDIYSLEAGDLSSLPGMGALSEQKLLAAIAASRTTTLARFIFALGIRHVGDLTAKDVAREIQSRYHGKKPLACSDAIAIARSMTVEEWQGVAGIGEIVAQSLTSFFSDRSIAKWLDRLIQVPWTFATPAPQRGVLAGVSFVLTGTLEGMSRSQAIEKIEALGGRVHGTVTKGTTYLLAGEGGGSKRAAAKKLGVQLLSQEEFFKMINES